MTLLSIAPPSEVGPAGAGFCQRRAPLWLRLTADRSSGRRGPSLPESKLQITKNSALLIVSPASTSANWTLAAAPVPSRSKKSAPVSSL